MITKDYSFPIIEILKSDIDIIITSDNLSGSGYYYDPFDDIDEDEFYD